jgi:hypothetical protein
VFSSFGANFVHGYSVVSFCACPISESLARYVAEESDLNVDLGVKGKSGILKSKASRTEFLSDPTHQTCLLDESRGDLAKRVFLKSSSPSFPYTDFTEKKEKDRFLRDFSVKLRVVRVVRVLKRYLRNGLSGFVKI